MRESEAQTIPTPLPDDPSKIKVDGSFQEILELKDFSYGNGLPVDMYEIELITKAREKRAFNDALPPLSDEASFALRNKFTNEQETREWTQKEKDIEELNAKRLAILQQFLEKREQESEIKRLKKIDNLKEKKDDDVEAQKIKIGKKRVKIIRNIAKKKEMFKLNKGKIGRDIIQEYSDYGSKVYAPLTRDGHNPDRHAFRFELDSSYLTEYENLDSIQSDLSTVESMSFKNINESILEKRYSNSLGKLEKVHSKEIDNAFKSIVRQEQKAKAEMEKKAIEKQKKLDEARNKKTVEVKIETKPINEQCILLQRLLRGRKEQIMMQKGKRDRFELIKELKRADEWKKAEGTDEVNKLIDNYKEKLAEGVIDAIQGDNIAKTLDYLSKQLIRIKEEKKINAIVEMAENERRKRHAEEMGRRQAENILRKKKDNMNEQLTQINQGTMDSYINSLFTNTVNTVSKKQVNKEISIKAHKLNRIVDKIEKRFVKDDIVIRDLVSSFIIPEIVRKKNEDKNELEEKRFIERAKVAISSALDGAQKEYK